MSLSRRSFLKSMVAAVPAAGGGCVALRGGRSQYVVEEGGFGGFAQVLAYARSRIGEGVRVVWRVRGDGPLGECEDDARIRIVATGRTDAGKWHLETRGICMEFMLRMEVMGPVASTPHPRPGQAWEPELRVKDARRLMERMLRESGVEIEGVPVALRVARGKAGVRSFRLVRGGEFVEGQRLGTADAWSACLGRPVEVVLRSEEFRRRLARDLALSG